MANTARRDRPLLGYFGGLLAAIVLCAAALVALAVLRPIDEASAPEAPAQAEEEAAALPEQETQDEEVAAIPPEEAPSGPSRPEPVPQPSAGGNPELRNVPEPGPLPSDGGFAAPEPFEAPGGDGQIGDLATLPGGPSLTEPGASPALTVPTVEGPALQLDGPALEVNAAAFETDGGTPLIAVVLNDAGASDLSVEALTALSVPLTLGIVPRGDIDLTLAAEAKLAGYEVLAQLPVGAGTGSGGIDPALSDVEIGENVEALMTDLWMSIGASALDAGDAGIEERMIRAMIAPLQPNGYAFVNANAVSGEAGSELAAALGVPYAVQDVSVPADALPEEIAAAIEQAAEAAAGSGTAILSGPASRAMLEAIFRWSTTNSGRARFAPISAVIRTQNAG